MFNWKKFVFILLFAALLVPLTASAFWFWNKPVKKAPNQNLGVKTEEFSQANKELAEAKYKLWESSFEKKDIELIIKNKNNFWFSSEELNYLFNKENSKAKKPLLSNFFISNQNNQIKVSAYFKKIISGKFSFDVKIENKDNKIRLKISKVKIYNIPAPAALISGKLNESLDNYFSFIYKDPRYEGFEFTNQNNILKLNLNFSK